MEMINSVLAEGMPMEKLTLSTFHIQNQHAIAAEEALIAMHANVSIELHRRNPDSPPKPSPFKFPEPTSFGTWYRRVAEQRVSPLSTIFLSSLSYSNFDDQILHLAEFHRASFQYSSLRYVRAYGIVLWEADLKGADISRSHLEDANCMKGNFENSLLQGSILDGARFTESNLEQADLSDSSVMAANFEGANLFHSQLDDVDLSETNIEIEETEVRSPTIWNEGNGGLR